MESLRDLIFPLDVFLEVFVPCLDPIAAFNLAASCKHLSLSSKLPVNRMDLFEMLMGAVERGYLLILQYWLPSPLNALLPQLALTAAFHGHLPVLKWLIQENRIDRSDSDVLYHSLFRHHMEVAKFLIEENFPLNHAQVAVLAQRGPEGIHLLSKAARFVNCSSKIDMKSLIRLLAAFQESNTAATQLSLQLYNEMINDGSFSLDILRHLIQTSQLRISTEIFSELLLLRKFRTFRQLWSAHWKIYPVPLLLDDFDLLSFEKNLVNTCNIELVMWMSGFGFELEGSIGPLREMLYPDSIAEPALAKSPNKQNRVYMQASPLNEDLLNYLEVNLANAVPSLTEVRSVLVSTFGWKESEAKRLVFLRPGSNSLFLSHPELGKYTDDSAASEVVSRWVAREGPLCDAPLRGIKFELVDAQIHHEMRRHSLGQLLPALRRSCYGALLLGNIGLSEPFFHVELTYLETLRGRLLRAFDEVSIEAVREVADNFLFKCSVKLSWNKLRTLISKIKNCSGIHLDASVLEWQPVPGDWRVEGTPANLRLRKERRFYGFREGLPEIDMYLDKL